MSTSGDHHESSAQAPQPGSKPRSIVGLFRRGYGASPGHLIGHILVVAITAYVLSIMFQARFAPQPLNLVLWLLGGAILHDGVFLPIYGVINLLVARLTGAGTGDSLKKAAMGPEPVRSTDGAEHAASADSAGTAAPADTAAADRAPAQWTGGPTRDQQRRVPLINYIRTPFLVSAVLFIVFVPRILNRQPQNFVNALGHPPPDFFMRWVWVTLAVFALSALIYAVRWLRADRAASGTPHRPSRATH